MMVEKISTKKNYSMNGETLESMKKKIADLKIELLKNPTKRGRVKKEIARLLTMANSGISSKKETKVPASSGKNSTKLEDEV